MTFTSKVMRVKKYFKPPDHIWKCALDELTNHWGGENVLLYAIITNQG